MCKFEVLREVFGDPEGYRTRVVLVSSGRHRSRGY